MTLGGRALFAVWGHERFLTRMIVKVILGIWGERGGGVGPLLVACSLRHAVCHALRCVMCSALSRFAPLAVHCGVGFAGNVFWGKGVGQVLCGALMVVFDDWQSCRLKADLRTGVGTLWYHLRAAHALLL